MNRPFTMPLSFGPVSEQIDHANSKLRGEVIALREEIAKLRAEIEALKGGKPE